ncbi:MAG: hypothetical protein IJV01_00620 [Bacteroidales bacterium]|nr:hypothetical protein [Bacteroidales bacterium]
MKKIFRFALLAAAAVAALSCAKDNGQAPAGVKTWTVSAEFEPNLVAGDQQAAPARTNLGGDHRTVNWNASDKVAIITYNESTSKWDAITDVVPTSVSGSSASFTFDVPDGFAPKYVSYPSRSSSSYNTTYNGIRTKIDEPLYLAADEFPYGSSGATVPNANTSIGAISAGSATMRNVFPMLKLTLSRTDIVRIEVTGNNGETVSGFPCFDPSTLDYVGALSPATTMTLLPKSGSAFAAGTYYFPIIPQTYSNGITLTFYDADGKSAVKASDASWVPTKNIIYNLGTEGSDWVLPTFVYASPLEFSFTVSNGSKSSGTGLGWPFYGDGSSGSFGSTIEPAAATWRKTGQSGYFYMPTLTSLYFYLYVSSLDNSNYLRITTGAGLRIGSTYGDYMQLPAVPGLKLTKVVLNVGSAPCCVAVTDATTDLHTADPSDADYQTALASATVSGGAGQRVTGTKESPVAMTFNLTGTAINTAYRLTVVQVGDETGQVSFQSITLTYQD